MEADWAAEVGPDLPIIDVPWDGFVDLRLAPSNAATLAEAGAHPAIAEALAALNALQSPVFTVKCDGWSLAGYEIDPDEFAADAEHARDGFASYFDILRLDPAALARFRFHERWARSLTKELRRLTLSNGRVDLVIRPASVNSYSGYGITLYAAGCGADSSAAYASWEAVLRAAVTATINLDSTPALTGE